MKKHTFTLALFIIAIFNTFSQNLYNELFDNSGGINAGYGSWGNYNYIRETPIDVPDKGTITFYHPAIASVQLPTLIFISGWGQTYQSYDKYFKFVASLGYSVINIYNLHPGSINTSYPNSLDMIQQAVTTYFSWIDTSRIGLAGHSYGGGATVWLGYHLFDPDGLNWGTNGRFIMMFAPWYPFLIEDFQLQNYPVNVKLVVLQSQDDIHQGNIYNTDPRILRAMYQLINIPDRDKDYISVFSDNDILHQYSYNGNTFSYEANHYIVYTDLVDGLNNPYDKMDVYISNRLTHAMLSYVFEGDTLARNVILGNGTQEQINMDNLPDLAVTDYYVTTRSQSQFEYKCAADPNAWSSTDIWKLSNYCDDNDHDGHIDVLSTTNFDLKSLRIYPVPATDFVVIRLDKPIKIDKLEIFDVSGKKLYENSDFQFQPIDISKWIAGIYYIKLSGLTVEFFGSFVKQ